MLKLTEALPNANMALLHQMANQEMHTAAKKGGGCGSSATGAQQGGVGTFSPMSAQQDGGGSSSAICTQQEAGVLRDLRGNTLADTATTGAETATGETTTTKCIRGAQNFDWNGLYGKVTPQVTTRPPPLPIEVAAIGKDTVQYDHMLR